MNTQTCLCGLERHFALISFLSWETPEECWTVSSFKTTMFKLPSHIYKYIVVSEADNVRADIRHQCSTAWMYPQDPTISSRIMTALARELCVCNNSYWMGFLERHRSFHLPTAPLPFWLKASLIQREAIAQLCFCFQQQKRSFSLLSYDYYAATLA